jgi:hypothetical protein
MLQAQAFSVTRHLVLRTFSSREEESKFRKSSLITLATRAVSLKVEKPRKMAETTTITLNNGHKMPILGMGVWRAGESVQNLIL